MENLQEMLGELNCKRTQLEKKLEQIISALSTIQNKNTKLKKQILKQEKEIKFLEKEVRRKNIVIKKSMQKLTARTVEELESSKTTEYVEIKIKHRL